MNEKNVIYNRREMVRGAGLAAGLLLLGQPTWAQDTAKKDEKDEKDKTATGMGQTARGKDITSTEQLTVMEDLTCQHAVADRLLLTYQMALLGQMQAGGGPNQPPAKTLGTTAGMLRSLVEDYHAKLEEDHIFPLFQKANKQTDLVNTLREQHAAARRVTDAILQLTSGTSQNGGSMEPLVRHIMAYTQLIHAHTAYEETLLYPQIRAMLSDSDYNQLHKTIADADRQKLGPEGFSGLLAKVTDLEKSAGITSLAQFTPRLGEPVARESSGG